MNTITAILEPDADGTPHLPLPENLRQGKVIVTATLALAHPKEEPRAQAGVWRDLPGFWMSPNFDEPLEEFVE